MYVNGSSRPSLIVDHNGGQRAVRQAHLRRSGKIRKPCDRPRSAVSSESRARTERRIPAALADIHGIRASIGLDDSTGLSVDLKH